MNAYGNFTRQLSSEQEDVIYLQKFNYNETSHPREVMTIRRSNGIPYPIFVNSVIQIIEKGDGKDPVTRYPFSDTDIKRAYLYNECIKEFPNYKLGELNTKRLYEKWIATYHNNNFSDEDVRLTRLEARCFLQAEDLLGIFKTFYGKGSMLNREEAIKIIEEQNISWVLRDCSVKDTKYEHAYCLSLKRGDRISHLLIIHKLGEGFYYDVYGIVRGDMANKPITQHKGIYPTIIDLLVDNVRFT